MMIALGPPNCVSPASSFGNKTTANVKEGRVGLTRHVFLHPFEITEIKFQLSQETLIRNAECRSSH